MWAEVAKEASKYFDIVLHVFFILYSKLFLDCGEDQVSVAEVHTKWDKLKAAYLRSKKTVPSGSSGKNKKDYKYAASMSFLDDTQLPRPSSDLGGTNSDRDSSASPANPVKSTIL